MKELDEYIIGPWGSWRNFAADQLGVWVWNGERDSVGQPCRWRMSYTCDCSGGFHWLVDWSCMVDDTCPNCGHLATADGVEDLLLDTEICPDDMED